jgi:hypothetical protein
MSEQEKLEKIILPAEFQSLPVFHDYLKIANYGLTRMKMPQKFPPLKNEKFASRDFGLQSMLCDNTK